MKTSTGHGYHGRYRKGMYDSGGKNHLRAYEGIFSKLNWNARKGGRNVPKFSFFEAKENYRTGICKLCMTHVKVFYTAYTNKPFLVNIEDKQEHRKWIGAGGWHCVISKNDKPKEESETMKRLKGKKWKPSTDDGCFYVEPE